MFDSSQPAQLKPWSVSVDTWPVWAVVIHSALSQHYDAGGDSFQAVVKLLYGILKSACGQ